MTSLQHCKFVKLFPDEKIKIAEGSSVYSLMQACASQIEILPEFFHIFRIVQKRSILLPYRKKLPNFIKGNAPLTFRVVDFNFDLQSACYKDLSLLNYLYHQVMFDVFSDANAIDSFSLPIFQVLAADILKLVHQLDCKNVKEAYNLYFELYDSRLPFKSRLSYEKFENVCSKINSCSEFSCLVHIVTVYAKEIYPELNIIKRTYNAKMSNKCPGAKGKSLEKKFFLEVLEKCIIAKSDDKQHEDIFFLKLDKQSPECNSHGKVLQHISFLDRNSISLVYKIGTQSDPVVLSFKSAKELEAFSSLIDYYFYSVTPYNFLITKFNDMKIDENSVQHLPDSIYNLINRDPYVSHFMDAEDAKNGLQKVLQHTGSFAVVSKLQSFLLLYTIQDKITSKQICRREGLYQIVGNEACKTKSIKSFVTILKPTIEGRRVNLDKHMSDSVLIDVLTFDNFLGNIPPMLVSIKHPYVHCSYTHKTYDGSFLDLSGHEKKCKVLEFSEMIDRRRFLEIYTSLLPITRGNIVKYIGLCKIGRTPRIYAFVNYGTMTYLDKFLDETPPAPYTSLSIIQQIASALKKLHSLKIEHGCPAPHHVLVDTLSCQSAYETPQLGINVKLTDIGLTKMMFLKETTKNPFCMKNPFCTNDRQFELRWLPENFLMHPSSSTSSFSVSVDRWVFGVTVWQIFNSGSIPLGKHSNEELLNRYMKIQEQINCLDGNMASNMPTLGWFPIKLDIPKQNELTVNKKIQKLVNYTITDHLNDQEDAFEEIADLFNDDVFPLDRSVNIYEKLEKDTEMKIERKDGKLYFKKQQIAALTQPVLYAPSVDPYFEDFNTNVFDDRTECSDNSDCSSQFDCENMDPETDFSYSAEVPDWYQQATNSNYSYNCESDDPFIMDELSFTLLHECELQNQLHKFNNKKWESSFYKLGREIGKGNFGRVHKAVVLANERIPPELRRCEIAVKIFTLPSGTHEDAIETIVQEAENMLHLEHHRIVPLYGISSSLENKEIHIVMPFYHLGSLKSYITQYLHELKKRDLCQFGLQIAEGMEYLNSKGFVHRDLALRNILVDNTKKNVRIADLGLTRGVAKEKDYYYIVNKSMKAGLPTFWYPPEFFNKSKYDKYCDVWSYGVTMYEMWSNGETPYKKFRVTRQPELIEFLKERTLDIPSGTPPIFSAVMKRCWTKKKERWDFTAIVNFIRSNLATLRIPGEREETYIYTRSRQCGGHFAKQKVLVKETAEIKLLKPFNFTARKDVENRDPEINYDELTVYRYVTDLSEEHIKTVLTMKHRHMIQYVGFVHTEGLLYVATPVHSIGTLYDLCINAKSDLFTRKKAYAAQVLQAMLYLHSQNITHGSLSVHNVWLRESTCAVICEAGLIQKVKLENLTSKTVVTYPPEVLEKVVNKEEVELDARSDTWMYGVMLLQLFCPELPPYSEILTAKTEGCSKTVEEICGAICNVLKENTSALCTGTVRPPEIKEAISVCLTEYNSRGDLGALKSCFQLQG
ncbi:hypothetical protein ACHWQZ_G012424 [Mnemiopsis leidyi]